MFKDFGLVDRIYNKLGSSKKDHLIGDTNFTRTIFNDDSSETFVCFLPWRVGISEAQKLGLIPKTARTILYEGPIGFANSNPEIARKLQSDIVEDIREQNLGRFSVLSYSIGTYPGFYIANNFPTDKLIAVVPGAKLGACIWDGIATQKVKSLASKDHGIMCHSEYDSVLYGTNPIENISNLPSNIEIHLATNDNYIKTHHGEALIEGLIAQGKNPKIIKYNGKGHILTLAEFGKNNVL
ncbi:MAG: hypothetical protein PF572_00790 [Patescibacteria group bacterium]|jgi:hypothetical protein|nr:hypothetical protein [Patescibacteria group bacterium]